MNKYFLKKYSALPLQGAWVRFLVGELRSWVPQGGQKKKKDLSLSDFYGLIMMCPGVNLFQFILVRVCWASTMCRLMFFIKFDKF